MSEAVTLREIRRRNHDFELRVAFDVGAHVGNVSKIFLDFSKDAVVHAFEPVPLTFEKLSERFHSQENLVLNRVALSSVSGVQNFTIGRNTGNRFAGPSDGNLRTDSVKVVTGDQYCSELQIHHIDFLKIDTEGHDLETLLGFRNTLAERRIEFIQVECTPDLRNKYHVPLFKISSFLELFGYSLFGLGELVFFDNEAGAPSRSVWYCNAVFVRV